MPRNKDLTRRHMIGGLAALPVLAGCATTGMSTRRAGTVRAAVLLPLSGRNAALGQQIAKAIWLHEDAGVLPGKSLIQDTGDTPDQAAEAARAVLAQGANVIVGPVSRHQTPAVLRAAAETPVITLSNDRDLAKAGAWVFGVTPMQSADAVLRYASTAETRQIAVIDGGNSVSQRALAALQAGARKAGVADVLTVPGTTPAEDIPAALRRAAGGTLPDVLYVPDAETTAQAQARAALAENVTTIGSLQWSGLSREAFLRLDKACYTGPDPLRFTQTSAFYQQQLNEQMGVIAALGVDAVAFAHAQGGKANLTSRTPIPGLLGPAQFTSDRTLERELAVLQIKNGGVERVA